MNSAFRNISRLKTHEISAMFRAATEDVMLTRRKYAPKRIKLTPNRKAATATSILATKLPDSLTR